MSTPANLYDILGVSKDATSEEVRKAYRKKALQTHPDRLPQNVSPADKAAAEEQFRLVNNAYEVLNNSENRKLYDRHGVWPPPTEQPDIRRDAARDPFGFSRDSFANDPFFNAHFGPRFGSRGPQFTFTDPFELFNSMVGDLHSAFQNDPLFANTPFTRSPFDDPFFRTPFGQTRDPFAGTPFGGALSRPSPLGGSMFGGSPFGAFFSGPAFHSSNTRVYSSATHSFGSNDRFISRSQTSRTINGRTESITKRIDADGNEHVTYSSPDGERHTINGVEQPHGTIDDAPRRSNTTPISRQPPPVIADRPAESPVNVAPPAQPFNVPISSSRRDSHAHPRSQPVVPPMLISTHERRSSRHSHRERGRAMTEDPHRSRRVALITTRKLTASLRARPAGGLGSPSTSAHPVPMHKATVPVGGQQRRDSNQMDVDPPAGSGMPGAYASGDARVRDKHSSHHSSRHSHAYGDTTGKDRDRDRDSGSPTSTGSRRGGWRGWFSTVLHPFRRNHNHKEM